MFFRLPWFFFCCQVRVACVYGNVGNEALMITKDDEVYAVGSNGAGCLGLGDMLSTLFPKKLEPLCSKVQRECWSSINIVYVLILSNIFYSISWFCREWWVLLMEVVHMFLHIHNLESFILGGIMVTASLEMGQQTKVSFKAKFLDKI